MPIVSSCSATANLLEKIPVTSSQLPKHLPSVLCLVMLASCTPNLQTGPGPITPNSRSRDEQPALSGNGRWLAFVSNRNGSSQILLYDLERQQLSDPGIPQDAVFESPSLSRTGRYIVYLASPKGKPEVFLYDRATKRSEAISRGYRSLLRNPHISPDGRYIVFETARRGQWDIEVLDRGPNVELDISNGSPVVSP